MRPVCARLDVDWRCFARFYQGNAPDCDLSVGERAISVRPRRATIGEAGIACLIE